MKLILIRHGTTNYNLEKRYCGFKDVAINKAGETEAKNIKYKLRKIKIDKVFCSNLKRSVHTARIIFADRKCPILKKVNLREINFGKWEGLNFKQILQRYSSIYKKWLDNPFSVNIPGGERTLHFVKRVKKELKHILKSNAHKTIAIVSHAGTMRVILNTTLGARRKDFWKPKLKPEAIYSIKYNG